MDFGLHDFILVEDWDKIMQGGKEKRLSYMKCANCGTELKDGTLYISLKRLESKGFIESYWQSSQGPGNRRKYYKITQYGIESLDIKVDEWNFVKNIMDKFLDGRDGNGSNK